MTESQAFASQVCLNCKAQKKKCSKHLPTCELCSKLLRQCHYNLPTPDPEAFSSVVPDLQLSSSLLDVLSQWSQAPDTGLSSTLASGITKQVLSVLVRNRQNVPSILLAYFNTIHIWLPILSQEKYVARMETLTMTPSAELAGLLLSMGLITQTPANTNGPYSMKTPMYFKAKALNSALVLSGKPLIEIVQAGLLICLYEQGHGMIEQARITMATCARLAITLDVENRRLRARNIQDTEFGRTWWGLVILDRFMNLGIPGDEIYLIADSQALRSVKLDLPDDDKESQETVSAFPRTPSGVAIRPPTTALGPFCRTVQATHLLGQTLDLLVESCIDGHFDSALRMSVDESLQRLAMSLLQQAVNGWEECCGAIGVCISALVTLHEARWRGGSMSGNSETPFQDDEYEAAKLALRSAIRIVVDICRKFEADLAFIDILSLPLLSAFPIYISALLHIQLGGPEMFSQEWESDLKFLKDGLVQFAKRWDIANRYLERIDTAVASASHARYNG